MVRSEIRHQGKARMNTKLGCGALAFLSICSGIAHGQMQDSYRGFRIGMVLSETFAVGGGNLEKAQAACVNPPTRLSSQEHDLLTKVCAKMQRTLAGQPAEWEFPKEQLRLAFDNMRLIRVSDFDGVIHLQATQSQIGAFSPSSAIVAPTSAQQPLAPSVPGLNQDQDVAVASRAAKAKQAAQGAPAGAVASPAVIPAPMKKDTTTVQQKTQLTESSSVEEVVAFIHASKEGDPTPPVLQKENLSPAFARAASKALILITVNPKDADSWLGAAEDLASPGPDGLPEMSALIDLHRMQALAYRNQKPSDECQKDIYFQLQIRHYFSTPKACGFETNK
jgi:hypothetical protein